MMRVAMYYNNEDVRLEEMPVPEIGPGELLVKVMASGVCGSDVMEWYRIKKAPLVLGHEITGEIVSLGEGVNSVQKRGQSFCLSSCSLQYLSLLPQRTAYSLRHITQHKLRSRRLCRIS